MKKLSLSLLSDTVISRRKALNMTQAELAKKTGMNRSMLSKLETQDYIPPSTSCRRLQSALALNPLNSLSIPKHAMSPRSPRQ